MNTSCGHRSAADLEEENQVSAMDLGCCYSVISIRGSCMHENSRRPPPWFRSILTGEAFRRTSLARAATTALHSAAFKHLAHACTSSHGTHLGFSRPTLLTGLNDAQPGWLGAERIYLQFRGGRRARARSRRFTRTDAGMP